MSVTAKLAAFTSVLILVFAIGVGVGRLFEGQVPSQTPNQPSSTSTHTHR